MKPVGGELVGRDIGSKVAGFRTLREHASDHVEQLVLGVRDLPISMQQGRELGVLVTVFDKPKGLTPYGQRKREAY